MAGRQLHFVLLPLPAPGHMIPIIDIAKLLARRGVSVTLITTPLNAARVAASIHRAKHRAGLDIHLLTVPFPSVEAGLPEGCENFDSLPSLDMAPKFFKALTLLHAEAGKLFDELKPPPSCLISDMGLPWTTQIAEKFSIPRMVFHGRSCFSLLCSHNILASNIVETLDSDSDYFEVPNLPDRIGLRKCQATGTMSKNSSVVKEISDQIKAAEKISFGVVVNSFQELEPEYVKAYSKVKGEKVWCIGPVSLCNNEAMDLVERGNKTSISEQDCLKWLDSNEPGSAVYASLGSLCRLVTAQMIELALGLEASNRPFIWSLGGGDKAGELERWIKESGFEERVKERGVVIRGWAPQVLILSHPAVGGFLTHAGWNSTLEAISAGVPMVTWPLFADQFFNEKLVLEVLGIGVSVGVEAPVRWGEEEKVGVVVGKDDVKKALDDLMDGGEEAEERRKKARRLGEVARRAMLEGSSHGNVTSLIEEIRARSEGER